MNYNELLSNAKKCIGEYCKACIECNGKVCKNQIPGPGVKGIGEKTALKLLQKYNSLEGVYENIEDITGSTKDKLEIDKDNYRLIDRFEFINLTLNKVNLVQLETSKYNEIFKQKKIYISKLNALKDEAKKEFEKEMLFLKKHNYKTLTLKEIECFMEKKCKIKRK